jgi:hypothetical protein
MDSSAERKTMKRAGVVKAVCAGLVLAVWFASVAVVKGAEAASIIQMESKCLILKVNPVSGTMAVRDKAGGMEWGRLAEGKGEPRYRNLKSSGLSINFEAACPSDASKTILVKLTLAESAPELSVEMDMADRATKIGQWALLEPIVFDSAKAGLVVADYANGHLYPLDMKPFPRTWFSLWGIDMPWVGVCDLQTGAGYAIIVDTPEDAYIQVRTVEGKSGPVGAPVVGWAPSRGTFAYPRRFFYHFATQGGYVALAKRYREYAKSQGLIVPFTEKVKVNPNVARLFGAPDVWGAWGKEGLKFAKEAKAAGVDKMILHGEPPSEDMKVINEMGYLTSCYDNYTDIFQVEAGKDIDAQHGQIPGDVVLKADGQQMTAWLTWDKKQYMKRCPGLWTAAAKVVIPKALAARPYLGRFIDVTTAEELYECFAEGHPLSRKDKLQAGIDLFRYTRGLGLVLGGEHGRWWAVPYLDYIEGMMSGGSYSWPSGHLTRPKTKDQKFTSPWGTDYDKWENYEKWGIGHEFRVPLWELVFHDCIVSTWYWGDSSDFLLEAAPEVTPKKDAFNVLYGTIPILWANKEGSWTTHREIFLRSYRNTCKLHEQIATAEMISHEFVTADRAVQRTRFSDGTEAIVNFGGQPQEVELAGKKYRLPQNGFAVKGPKIEQSREMVDGKIRTTIKSGEYQFSEIE